MKVIDVIENEDGSCTLELDLTKEEVKLLINYAIVDILKEQIKNYQEE